MSLIRQLVLVAALGGLGIAAYHYGWPLVAPADGDRAVQGRGGGQAAQGRRGADRAATVLVKAMELRAERTRLQAVGTAQAYRSVTLHPAAAGEVAAVHFAPDQKVRKGTVLLELDSRSETLASSSPACGCATRASSSPATNARSAAARSRGRPSPTPAAPSMRPKSRCARPK